MEGPLDEKFAIFLEESTAPTAKAFRSVVILLAGEPIVCEPGPEFPAEKNNAQPAASTLSIYE